MHYREIARVLSSYLFFFALALVIPLALAGYYQFFTPPETHPQPHSFWSFWLTMVVCLCLALGCYGLSRGARGALYRREGLAVVVVIWFVTAVIGGLPFYFNGTFEDPVDAYFEAMSGLTTTGASVMHPKNYDPFTEEEVPWVKVISEYYEIEYSFYGTIQPVRDPVTNEILYEGIEAVGKALLFWRSFMQWLGGMGIVVLFVAVLPALGVGGKILFQAEVPGPIKDSLTPRIKETAGMLWKFYLGFTLAQIFLMRAVNPAMDWFEACTITFSTLSTGGFTAMNQSVGAFQHPPTEWIILLFMLFGSINFTLYFYCLKGKFYRLFDPELLIYLSILLGASAFVAWNLVGEEFIRLNGDLGIFDWTEAIRASLFHVVSAQSSTGFATMDFDKWPYVVQAVLLLVMFVGAMSGSTGGGIKIIRHYIVFQVLKNKLEAVFQPSSVRQLRLGSREMSVQVALTVFTFLMIVIALSALGTFLLAMDGVDLETALAVNSCMVNNIGMAFRMAGPTESFAFLSTFSKLLCSFWMVLGRLEFFAVLVVLMPGFWRRN